MRALLAGPLVLFALAASAATLEFASVAPVPSALLQGSAALSARTPQAADIRSLLDPKAPVVADLGQIARMPAAQARASGLAIMDRVLESRGRVVSDGSQGPIEPESSPSTAKPLDHRGLPQGSPQNPQPPAPREPKASRNWKGWFTGLAICSVGMALIAVPTTLMSHLPLWSVAFNAALGALAFAVIVAPAKRSAASDPEGLESLARVLGGAWRRASDGSLELVVPPGRDAQAAAAAVEAYLSAHPALAQALLARGVSLSAVEDRP